jgi:transcription termination factor Rho
MDEFKDYKSLREEKYKHDSRDRLGKILKKKVETTMIGALSSIEENLGFLWNSNSNLTEEQEKIYNLYQKIRSEILDKGNTQARNIDVELSQYDIKWLRYSVTIPVKNA